MMPFLGHPLRVLLATAQTFALTHVVWAYGVSIGFGWGPSMMPTFLATNEWFVTDKRYRRGRGVQVGDCIVYAIPVEPGEEGLKRVMGMPGDYVLLNSPPSTAARAGRDGTDGVGVDRVGRGVGSENMIQVSPYFSPFTYW
jgi:inner membrane protease subunit 1